LPEVIHQAGLNTKDIDLVIPHQANVRIIESATKFAGLPEEKTFINLHKSGNTSANSIPLALAETMDEGRAKGGRRWTLLFLAQD
jgi:3-oxoacyl-[acyl-carrier-protein] synthase-3